MDDYNADSYSNVVLNEHPFLHHVRREMNIPGDAKFIDAYAEKFMVKDRASRAAELARFDAAQKHNRHLREESGLAEVRRRLRAVDEKLRTRLGI